MGDTQDAGCLSIDDDRRGVNAREAHGAVARDVARFKTLRLARERRGKSFEAHVAIGFMRALEKTMADYFFQRVARHLEHRLVAPFVAAFLIERVNSRSEERR